MRPKFYPVCWKRKAKNSRRSKAWYQSRNKQSQFGINVHKSIFLKGEKNYGIQNEKRCAERISIWFLPRIILWKRWKWTSAIWQTAQSSIILSMRKPTLTAAMTAPWSTRSLCAFWPMRKEESQRCAALYILPACRFGKSSHNRLLYRKRGRPHPRLKRKTHIGKCNADVCFSVSEYTAAALTEW